MSLVYGADPRISYLSELLEQVYQGAIQVPKFQRTLVWGWSQQRELLCSIYEGLPIGSLLIWNTRLNNIASYKEIGPFAISQSEKTTVNTYLMDGLQRLSTLYGMVRHPEPNGKDLDEIAKYIVFCDLEAEDVSDVFVLENEVSEAELEDNKYRFMPLKFVFDSKALIKFQRKIPECNEEWIDNSDSIVAAFKNYKIPIIPFDTDDQALVTKSFERINSRGTTMSETHMLNALTFSDKFELLGSLDSYYEEFLVENSEWFHLDRDFVVMLLKIKLGFDHYSKDTDRLAKRISENPTALRDVFIALVSLSKFSSMFLDIESPDEYPYRLQMLGIAEVALNNDLEEHASLLRSWFWLTTYTSCFGTTARNSQHSLQSLRELLVGGRLPWNLSHDPICRSLGEKPVSYKTARVKVWAIALADKLGKGNNVPGYRDILRRNRGQALFQPLTLKIKGEGKRAGSCFIVEPKNRSSFDILKLNEEEQAAHFVDIDMINLYKNEKYSEFCLARERAIFHWEEQKYIRPSALELGILDRILISY